MSSKDLYSITHYYHSVGQFIWPQTSISTEGLPILSFQRIYFKLNNYTNPMTNQPVYSVLPAPIPTHTHFQNRGKWVLKFSRKTNLDIISDSSPLLSLKLLTLIFKNSLVYLSLYSWSLLLLMLWLTLNKISIRWSDLEWSPFFQFFLTLQYFRVQRSLTPLIII